MDKRESKTYRSIVNRQLPSRQPNRKRPCVVDSDWLSSRNVSSANQIPRNKRSLARSVKMSKARWRAGALKKILKGNRIAQGN